MRRPHTSRGRVRDAGWRGLAVAIAGLAAGLGAASAAETQTAHSGRPGRTVQRRGLDVLPFPGTPDAAAATNIDFPGASLAQVASVTAVGSRSGPHGGRLSAQPAGHGTAFTPDRPFSPGERVSVTARFRSAVAVSGSGAPVANRVSFSFTVARPAARSSTGNRAKAKAIPARAGGSQPLTHSFVTQPGFTPPIVTMSGKDTDTASGDIFLGAQNSGQNAPFILDPEGRLIWYQPTPPHESARDVRVQNYDGRPAITYWMGKTAKGPGGGRGEDLILNGHYQTIHTVTAGDGYKSQGIDLHEFFLGQQGSETVAFVPIWSPVRADLTSVGGPPNGIVYDWIIQEIDVATGKVIWEWHALGHVPVSDSYQPYSPAQGYDYFHLNSIQQLPDGNVLVSSRNTWTVYLIDKATGKIIWRLGGKHSSFTMGAGSNFEWQHDATLLSNGILTLFDDGAAPEEESQSRALELRINAAKHEAALVHAFLHTPATLATSQGSAQLLPNGNVFVGWGSKPYFSEYTPAGAQIFSGSFVSPVASYRAFRHPWVGRPLEPPEIAVEASSTAGDDDVYASWNGATQVARWQVLTSSSSTGPFTATGSPVAWFGFETRTRRPAAPYFEVEALNRDGRDLGTSNAVPGP